jgi:four helix bundle protein
LRDFHQLKVWEKAHAFTLSIYKISSVFPKEELYGLTSQVRRAALSIPANIAEGCGKDGEADLARYFQISMGSSSELEYELLLAHDLGYIHQEQYELLILDLTEIRKMLNSFLQRLRAKPK